MTVLAPLLFLKTFLVNNPGEGKSSSHRRPLHLHNTFNATVQGKIQGGGGGDNPRTTFLEEGSLPEARADGPGNRKKCLPMRGKPPPPTPPFPFSWHFPHCIPPLRGVALKTYTSIFFRKKMFSYVSEPHSACDVTSVCDVGPKCPTPPPA